MRMYLNAVKKLGFVWNFALITIIYLASMIYLDTQLDLSMLSNFNMKDISIVFLFFIMSILLRYYRWHLLMIYQGVEHKLFGGFLFYVAGFAYTATPGKVGELSRAFFYNRINIPSYTVVSSFILERFFDLIVVLLMAGLLLLQYPSLHLVAYFIIVIILAVVFFVYNISLLRFICKLIKRLGVNRLTKLFIFFYLISKGIRSMLTIRVTVLSFTLGLFAWSCTSLILVYICYIFQLNIPLEKLYAIYPTAMLAGAISFIPGGLGATEAIIVFLLNNLGVSLSVSSAIAILVRLSTLWLAMLFGVLFSLLSNYHLRNSSE